MRILVDTNILVRTFQPEHPHHAVAQSALAWYSRTAVETVISPQNIY